MLQNESGRFDVVFIRKSSKAQDEKGQSDNVAAMLREMGCKVAPERWFTGVVSRRKVRSNPEFNRLLALVESDLIGTVYVESQDRWGTADRVQLFSLIGLLRDHNTRLYDLRGKKDLTNNDFGTEMSAVMASYKSENELTDLSYRSLRTRVNNFTNTGTWPTGTHPFGFGKACYTEGGILRWKWQPVSRTRGQVFYPSTGGKLKPGPKDLKLPRKEKKDKTKLVVSNNKNRVAAVRLIFDLFVRSGLSRRQISARLNAEGRTFYDRPWTHSLVSQVLTNPAYVGDTHFGKRHTGELHTFDERGLIVKVIRTAKNSKCQRDSTASNRIIKQDTHTGIVDRTTWELASAKLAAEQGRTSYAPRNPAYYLKQIFVCGHCGKGLTGRTEVDPKSGQRKVIYVCPTWMQGRSAGQIVGCGYQRISHAEAEQLLLNKITELNLRYDDTPCIGVRENLAGRLSQLESADDDARLRWWSWVSYGAKALVAYLKQTIELEPRVARRLDKLAIQFYRWGRLSRGQLDGLPVAIADFGRAVKESEDKTVEQAKEKVFAMTADHKQLTLAKARASELEQQVLQEEVDRIEAELKKWKTRMVPLRERLSSLTAAEDARTAERKKILAEWPTLEDREKGEALRRIFGKVTLFWDRTFRPAEANPSRPRKTKREGRYSYAIQHDRTVWTLADTNLGGTW